MLHFFEEFIFKVHHQREEELLYKWMVKQNKNSDSQLIEKIIGEHNTFLDEGRRITAEIQKFLQNKKDAPTLGSIRYDLSHFLNLYVSHIEKEETFIYLIAEGLAASTSA